MDKNQKKKVAPPANAQPRKRARASTPSTNRKPIKQLPNDGTASTAAAAPPQPSNSSVKEPVSGSSAARQTANNTLHRTLHSLAQLWIKFLIFISATLLAGAISVLFGLNTIVPAPIIDLVHRYPLASIAIICLLLCISLFSWYIARSPVPESDPEILSGRVSRQDQRLIFATAIAIVNTLTLLVLLFFVLVRPPWCPTPICPAPQLISKTIPLLHAEDVYDDKLEMYFKAIQSTSYVIPGDPTHYTLNNLPESIGALPPDGHNSTVLYHLILGLQNLQRGRFGMTIEQIDLVIQHVSPVPQTLNVWKYTSPIDNGNNNQYQAFYTGQSNNAILPTNFIRFRNNGFVHLTPGETDSIDIHFVSRAEATIQFSVQVIYRVDNESQEHGLRLPYLFEVIFANPSKWHLYHFQDGHFMLNS